MLSTSRRLMICCRSPWNWLLSKNSDPGLAERIEASIKRDLGARARVELLPAGAFPRTEGKTKRVFRRYS